MVLTVEPADLGEIRLRGHGEAGSRATNRDKDHTMRGVRFVAAGVLAATLFGVGGPAMAGSGDTIEIQMQDRCDPATFNAALQDPQACEPTEHGKLTFQEVLATMIATGGHPKWRFTKTDFDVKPGTKLKLTNTGGELHTFIQVPKLGLPGCAPPVNEAIGRPGLSTQCDEILPVKIPGLQQNAAFSGGSFTMNAPTAPGTYFYTCLIHPWMEATVTVKA